VQQCSSVRSAHAACTTAWSRLRAGRERLQRVAGEGRKARLRFAVFHKVVIKAPKRRVQSLNRVAQDDHQLDVGTHGEPQQIGRVQLAAIAVNRVPRRAGGVIAVAPDALHVLLARLHACSVCERASAMTMRDAQAQTCIAGNARHSVIARPQGALVRPLPAHMKANVAVEASPTTSCVGLVLMRAAALRPCMHALRQPSSDMPLVSLRLSAARLS
jgi:hypothetical protein